MTTNGRITRSLSRILPVFLLLVACSTSVKPSERSERGAPRGPTDSQPPHTAGSVMPDDTTGFDDRISDIRPTEADVTRRRLAILEGEIRRFRQLNRRLPGELQEVLRLPQSDSTLAPQARWLEDGWGRAFQYTLVQNGSSYELRSGGADGRFGTDDDIVSRSSQTLRSP